MPYTQKQTRRSLLIYHVTSSFMPCVVYSKACFRICM